MPAASTRSSREGPPRSIHGAAAASARSSQEGAPSSRSGDFKKRWDREAHCYADHVEELRRVMGPGKVLVAETQRLFWRRGRAPVEQSNRRRGSSVDRPRDPVI